MFHLSDIIKIDIRSFGTLSIGLNRTPIHMYERNDKQRIYWLINQYLLGNISESIFCDEFYYCYDLELDHVTLNDTEKVMFSELNQVSSRFSQYEEDHQLDSRAFSPVEELKQKVIETKDKLAEQNL